MKKPKKLSKDAIIQISSDISEDDLDPKATKEQLVAVIKYWMEYANKQREAHLHFRSQILLQVTKDMFP